MSYPQEPFDFGDTIEYTYIRYETTNTVVKVRPHLVSRQSILSLITNTANMYEDTKTKFDRIGFGLLYKQIAKIILQATIPLIVLLTLATVWTYFQINQMEYRSALQTTKYLNIKH